MPQVSEGQVGKYPVIFSGWGLLYGRSRVSDRRGWGDVLISISMGHYLVEK